MKRHEMKRTLTFSLAMVAVTAVSIVAFAQPYGRGGGREKGPGFGPGGRGPGPGMMMMGRCLINSPDLDLTDEQRSAIRDIRETARKEMLAGRDEMKNLRDSFINAFADPNVPESRLKEISDSIHAKMSAFKDRRFADFMKVRAVLTPEQLGKVPGIVKECRSRRGGFRGGRR
ncbi:MAG: Spy/CpxP family protein refolding chaperone [Deltaproteobacteria bacterium]|nr:Spy/CpxP family protein refolding chaperone [Deltaproteobacteria bacterium]